MATIDQFNELDIRVGTIIKAESFDKARTPAIKCWIDFGEEIGQKQTSAQLTHRYQPEELIGRQIVAVVNFPPLRIAGFKSEVLILGGVPEKGDVVLLNLDEKVPNGTKIS
jgi:tRNA-binding protein